MCVGWCSCSSVIEVVSQMACKFLTCVVCAYLKETVAQIAFPLICCNQDLLVHESSCYFVFDRQNFA